MKGCLDEIEGMGLTGCLGGGKGRVEESAEGEFEMFGRGATVEGGKGRVEESAGGEFDTFGREATVGDRVNGTKRTSSVQGS